MKKKLLMVGVFFCLFAVLLQSVPSPVYASRSLQDVTKEIQELKESLNTISNNIEAYKNNKAKAEAALEDYKVQLDAMLLLIEEQETLIALTMDTMDRKSQQLNDTVDSINQNTALYEERLLAIYKMNSSQAMLATMLNVSSFSDIVQVSDAVKRMTQRDTEVLQDLAEQQALYNEQRTDLENTIAQLNLELGELQENRDWCNSEIERMNTLISNASYNIKLSEQKLEETEEAIKEREAEYNRILAESYRRGSQTGDGSVRYGGPLVWPVPNKWKISSWYGDPRSGGRGHFGIDIPADTGHPIVAAGDGMVITSEWHYSYGYYIIIDHNDGLRTLYAHCSRLDVVVGNAVTAGQQIAAVGNTGNSYGAHLHLEVHDGGGRVNPIGPNYFTPIGA